MNPSAPRPLRLLACVSAIGLLMSCGGGGNDASRVLSNESRAVRRAPASAESSINVFVNAASALALPSNIVPAVRVVTPVERALALPNVN